MSDQVTYSHRPVSKQLSNQSPVSCFGKVSSSKKADKHASKKSGGSKRLTVNSPPFYQASSLEDQEKSDMIESYLDL